MQESKNNIRKSILAARTGMARDEISGKSSVICSKLLKLREFAPARLVMCYMDFRNEVMTGDFIKECIRIGKRVALPLVKNHTGGLRELLAYEIQNLESDVTTGIYGISEPIPERTKKVEETGIDLVVVPGAVFDVHKYRIGYGAGYYDRFLGKLKSGCIKAGIAFDMQITNKVPAEDHDIPMDVIITECRIIR